MYTWRIRSKGLVQQRLVQLCFYGSHQISTDTDTTRQDIETRPFLSCDYVLEQVVSMDDVGKSSVTHLLAH